MNNRKAKKVIYAKGAIPTPYRESLLILTKLSFSDKPKFRHVNYTRAYTKTYNIHYRGEKTDGTL